MNYTIQNKYLKATISDIGAELRELYDTDGLNRMHTPTNDTWNRVSPILFPQVSRIINSEYKVDGKTYNMTTHGFVRDALFDVVEYREDKIILSYSFNEETLKMYPYEFTLEVTYELIDNKLNVLFKVINPMDKKLLYMLGGHPAFKVPLYKDEKYSHYSLAFERDEEVRQMILVNNFLANNYEEVKIDKPIKLEHSLFTNDALIFKDLKSTYVDLVSSNHNKKIRFYFSDFKILAIWSKVEENCDFVCLEPWNGIQENFVIDHEKMGVLEVENNSFTTHKFTIEII
jgi:galactose mutarotase-like enzyme